MMIITGWCCQKWPWWKKVLVLTMKYVCCCCCWLLLHYYTLLLLLFLCSWCTVGGDADEETCTLFLVVMKIMMINGGDDGDHDDHGGAHDDHDDYDDDDHDDHDDHDGNHDGNHDGHDGHDDHDDHDDRNDDGDYDGGSTISKTTELRFWIATRIHQATAKQQLNSKVQWKTRASVTIFSLEITEINCKSKRDKIWKKERHWNVKFKILILELRVFSRSCEFHFSAEFIYTSNRKVELTSEFILFACFFKFQRIYSEVECVHVQFLMESVAFFFRLFFLFCLLFSLFFLLAPFLLLQFAFFFHILFALMPSLVPSSLTRPPSCRLGSADIWIFWARIPCFTDMDNLPVAEPDCDVSFTLAAGASIGGGMPKLQHRMESLLCHFKHTEILRYEGVVWYRD